RAIRIAFGKNHPIHRGNQNAQAIVELALILPILLVLIVGALEFGRLWSTKIILTNAAREGAYYLTTHTNECSISGSIITSTKTVGASKSEANSSGVVLADSDIGITGSSCAPGGSVTVTATKTVDNVIVIGLLRGFFNLPGSGNSVIVSSSVEMMIQ
ncbi:MAG: TadE/TadG family type IV pilus assembly protein, partial [Anaerolineaceae bacterium]